MSITLIYLHVMSITLIYWHYAYYINLLTLYVLH
jgi:hypothetical protein